MENKTVRISVDGKLYNEINTYCSLNNLNTNKYINELLRNEFLVSKYGDAPFLQQKNTIEETISEPIVSKLRRLYISPVVTVTTIVKEEDKKMEKCEVEPQQTIRRKRKLK